MKVWRLDISGGGHMTIIQAANRREAERMARESLADPYGYGREDGTLRLATSEDLDWYRMMSGRG